MNHNIGTGRFLLKPLQDINLSKNGIDFIGSLLTVDAQHRPNATVCLKLPWMMETEESFNSGESVLEELPITPARQAPAPPRPLPPIPPSAAQLAADSPVRSTVRPAAVTPGKVSGLPAPESPAVDPGPADLQSSYNEELPISSLQIRSSVEPEIPDNTDSNDKSEQEKALKDYESLEAEYNSLPALAECDSDSDSQEIKEHVEAQLSQRSNKYGDSSMQVESSFDSGIHLRNGLASSPGHKVLPFQQPGVRDFDSIGNADQPPPGAYMRLDTLPNSIPFRDIYVTRPVFTLGRVPDNDVQVEERRVSKRHCEIIRVPHSGSGVKQEIWLVDRSSNGCFLNGELIGAGKKALIESGDTICLFIDMDRDNKRKSIFHTHKHICSSDSLTYYAGHITLGFSANILDADDEGYLKRCQLIQEGGQPVTAAEPAVLATPSEDSDSSPIRKQLHSYTDAPNNNNATDTRPNLSRLPSKKRAFGVSISCFAGATRVWGGAPAAGGSTTSH
ncbi:ser/thr/tyr protein kinase RAD53 [Sugiyamaella lignohabitans]|uniref:Ser/thr/tyr protein kinase RAD53 n=1 Tax=Sugiyamaella lignohabitans TaxID=796027 RepID=A0A167C0R4_9ASCO|nr:ser/thr/tyr protein kinase RAD53 [Sugiyamaella lignohabitans]ANB11074.1 ser/thr/tyr protein kinase RAD53 [Sugiyamaella lignohabitans]